MKSIEFISTVAIPLTTDTFVARERFVNSIDGNLSVKFSEISDWFTEWFLWDGGKIEDPCDAHILYYGALNKPRHDEDITAEIGVGKNFESCLCDIVYLMSVSRGNDTDTLQRNGLANVFYVRDKDNVLRTIRVYWDEETNGWYVFTNPINCPVEWVVGTRVFSRSPIS